MIEDVVTFKAQFRFHAFGYAHPFGYGCIPIPEARTIPAVPAIVGLRAKRRKKAYKPLITTWMGTRHIREGREILKENNIPSYETPEEAIKTYLYMYRYKRNLELLYETPAELPVDQAPPKNHLKVFIKKTLKEERIVLYRGGVKGLSQELRHSQHDPFPRHHRRICARYGGEDRVSGGPQNSNARCRA